ncbi:long-chain-fatty-acid--CoA ligase [Paraburkholderia sp. D1E]|uniref:long-chain-fatty-acid--CoA ligase n=1 Tax=Paraburkholderia sp. D1E TaxID=3461398 RepID=UPI004045A6E8
MYLTQGLHRAMQQKPYAIATVCGNRRHNFAELGERVAKLAGAQQKLGLRPDDRVGILSLNSDRYLETFLAVMWAGGVAMPVNTRWSVAEIAYSLDDSDTALLFVDDTFTHMVGELRRLSSSLRTVVYIGDSPAPEGMLPYEEMIAASRPVENAMRMRDDLACLLYTGGTTGFPKGVMLSHENLYSNALALMAEGYPTQDGIGLHAAPMFHIADVGLTMALLLRGSTHVFVPTFTPLAVLEAIDLDRVTDILLVPTMIQLLADCPTVDEYELSSVRLILYGASPMSEAILERAFVVFPEAGFIQAYGMTEVAAATILRPYHHTSAGRMAGKLRSVGRAACHAEIRIVDTAGDDVPRGSVGEVVVRGPSVMKGYWRKSVESAAAVQDSWMHTGDGGYMDEDGFVFIVDRIKDMIVTGGENVYSAEVENAITKHPSIAMCAVIGIPDQKWGEGVHAVLILKPGASVSEQEIKAHCKSLIAAYKCPRTIEFRSELPISGAGKILKYRLRAPFWEGQARSVS